MSITDEASIDMIGVDQATQQVVLTIADHLDWSDPQTHLLHLQAKLNSYLEFVVSGDLQRHYSDATGRKVRFDVVGAHQQPDICVAFMGHVETALGHHDISLEFRFMPA
jgi:hypothetical protein